MKLSDLKTGMWAKTRSGHMHLIMKNCETKYSFGDVFVNTEGNGCLFFENYNENMEHLGNNHCDIVEVYRARENVRIFDIAKLDVIWKRKQKPELTPFEKEFLKALKPEYRNGWIARDKGGDLYAHDREPIKNGLGWVSRYCYEISDFANFPLFSRDPFTWCKWEDEEPWYIPDLLKEA